jgi:hypothetical protein
VGLGDTPHARLVGICVYGCKDGAVGKLIIDLMEVFLLLVTWMSFVDGCLVVRMQVFHNRLGARSPDLNDVGK